MPAFRHDAKPDNEKHPEASKYAAQISAAYYDLKSARRSKDQLRIELAEATLNALIESYGCNT